MEKLRILSSDSLFLSLTFLEETGQDICSSISLSLVIIDSKMISTVFLSPSHLPGTQVLSINELADIVWVSEDKDLKFRALQVLTPSLQVLINGQEFLVMSFVPSVCRNDLSRDKSYGVVFPRIGG